MPLYALMLAGAVLGFERLVEWQFGALGVIGFVLLSVGVKAKNITCSCVGAVVLTMLIV
ncbi:hypothetical protein H181DRAFT_04567 [Streptomyces sp. WMMB 714]|jgi:hypothetical protein|uniref:Uncharacterized protein n=2 Tax=Streptomyces TaxID=1883 RepID=A0ABV9A6C7_9ACTN|nr:MULTISPECIES: hypothetical protein [Streptomyces]GGO46614.1 hypothetical protein GCM10012287_17390 [Streptomyces daqingensis]SCK50401.1 hypothetical protein H181DRAFT_04567 [Streptomyces sp. WMMB 714]